MRTADVLPRLREELDRAGVDADRVTADDVRRVLDAVLRLAEVPVTDAAPATADGDGLLAQWGTYARSGTREFTVDLTRQLIAADGDTDEDGDEDPPITQVRCTLVWEPTPETDTLGAGHLWSFGMTPAAFADALASSAGFAWALATGADPVRLDLRTEDVC